MLCRTLGVRRGSFYAWQKREPSSRAQIRLGLVEQIKSVHEASKGTYGSPRVTASLRAVGEIVNHKRIERIMQNEGIYGCAKRKFRAFTGTDSKHELPIAPRVFEVQSKANFPCKPNHVWVSDSTYIATQEGWLYLTIQLDVYTRKVVGYTLSDHLKSEVVWESMQQAIRQQTGALCINGPQLIAHSDRGSQYASELYRSKLERLGIMQSMSRTGNCYDNAYAETFFHTLKVELVHRSQFETRQEAENAIREYIDFWYNPKRLHSGLGYKTPIDYERQALAA